MSLKSNPEPLLIAGLTRHLPSLVALLGIGMLGLYVVLEFGPRLRPRQPAEPRTVTPRGDLAADEKSTIELFRVTSPAVAYIRTKAVRRNAFSLNLQEISQGTGSGFVWDNAGHIVTNFHVIRDADRAQVTLGDNSQWNAQLVGVALDKDLAVLKIDAPTDRLSPIPIGTSGDLEVGQKVFAIGNPFGLDHTLTTGVISGLGRQIQSVSRRPIQGVIQTDAAINPGNSGGPLLDSAGRLIGVNTAIYSPSGAYAGIGFAVPVDTVNSIVPELISRGRVVRPGLGIRGALVINVIPGGAAESAGVRPTTMDADGRISLGDVIVTLDNNDVTSGVALVRLLSAYQVGDECTVTVSRDGRREEVTVTVQALD